MFISANQATGTSDILIVPANSLPETAADKIVSAMGKTAVGWTFEKFVSYDGHLSLVMINDDEDNVFVIDHDASGIHISRSEGDAFRARVHTRVTIQGAIRALKILVANDQCAEQRRKA